MKEKPAMKMLRRRNRDPAMELVNEKKISAINLNLGLDVDVGGCNIQHAAARKHIG